VVVLEEENDLGDAFELWSLRDLEEKHWTLGSNTHALEPFLFITITFEVDRYYLK
jgi:hypothetical protein